MGSGIELAAELSRDSAGNSDAVRSVGGSSPVKLNGIADTLGREVGDDLWQLKGGRSRWTGAGAAHSQRQKQRCSDCDEGWSGALTAGFGSELHCSQPSIFSSMSRNGEGSGHYAEGGVKNCIEVQ